MDSSEPPSKRATAASPRQAARDSQERGGSRKAGSDKRLTSAPSPVRPTGGILLAVGSGLAMGYYFAIPKRLLQQTPQPAPEFPAGAAVAIAALILLIAFLNLASTALHGVHKTRLRQLAEEEGAAARAARRILEDPERYQATIQIGITLAAMFAAALAATTLAQPLAYWLALLAGRTVPSLAAFALDISLVLGILCVAFLAILFGEFLPRHLAVRYSDQLIARIGGPVTTLAALASPLVSALTWFTRLLMRPFGEPAESTTGYLTEEEIKNLVEESEKEGVLEEQETEMIHSVLEFTDIVVREVMVPRIDMVCVEAQRSIDSLREVVLTSGHTRIPVYEETVDNIIGTVHAKDLLRVVRGDAGELSIRGANIMRPVYYVPENMKVDDLLAEFQQTKNQMAIVVDEYGGTAGLVTLEDLLEEIVGPITDEYDVEKEPSISIVDENVAFADARVSIDDVNEELQLHLPEEESETLGGFVFSLLGKIPSVGETVEYDNVVLEVVDADSRRVTRVKITRQLPETAEDTSEEDPPTP